LIDTPSILPSHRYATPWAEPSCIGQRPRFPQGKSLEAIPKPGSRHKPVFEMASGECRRVATPGWMRCCPARLFTRGLEPQGVHTRSRKARSPWVASRSPVKPAGEDPQSANVYPYPSSRPPTPVARQADRSPRQSDSGSSAPYRIAPPPTSCHSANHRIRCTRPATWLSPFLHAQSSTETIKAAVTGRCHWAIHPIGTRQMPTRSIATSPPT
jgi:hypothetical protein